MVGWHWDRSFADFPKTKTLYADVCLILLSSVTSTRSNFTGTSREAKTISESDALANLRVPELKHEDELAELGRLFNKMLDRMQRYIDFLSISDLFTKLDLNLFSPRKI